MATYGLKYITQFDGGPSGNERYTLEFEFLNWTGGVSSVTCGAPAVIHRWDKDEPRPGVKGSTVVVTLLNINGSLPLQSFYSAVDNNCRITLKWRDYVLFKGYVVQDDCREVMLDYTHAIEITATDGLGLLKDVPLDTANLIVGDGNRTTTGVQAYTVPAAPPAAGYLFINSPTTGALIGDTVIIEGTVGSNGVYTIVNVVSLGPSGVAIYVDRDFPFAIPDSTGYTFTFVTPVDLGDRITYAYLLRICLYSTNLLLNTDVYASIRPVGGVTDRFLEETLECADDYQDGNDNFKSCYDVLTIIMERFNATIFQAEGVWNVIRRDEHRIYENDIPGYRYDENMVYLSDITFNDVFESAPNIDPSGAAPLTYPETGIANSILRGYNFDKETFNYKQRPLLKNANLQRLGRKISSVTVGNIRTDKYEFPVNSHWTHFFGDDSYITIITELITGGAELEKERYVYQPKPGPTNPSQCVEFNLIEVNKGDEFDFECSIKCAGPSSNGHYFFGFYLQTLAAPSTGYWLANGLGPLDWNSGLFPITGRSLGGVTYLSGNAEVYYSFKLSDQGTNLKVPPFPADGLLTIRMFGTNDTNGSEPTVDAIWKDLKLTMRALISDSTQIIGQTHTNTQQVEVKNNSDEEIFVDDTPRNFLNGTQFLSSFTNLVQNRTSLWSYPLLPSVPDNRLGEYMTREELYWRRKERTKMEGKMYGLTQLITSDRLYTVAGVTGTTDPGSGLKLVVSSNLPIGVFLPGVVFTLSDAGANNGVYTVAAVINAVSFTVLESMPTQDSGFFRLRIQDVLPRHISMLTLMKYAGFFGLNFIFGTLSIDYKYNNFTGTFWEQWSVFELDGDGLVSQYVFRYLYQNK